MSFSLIRSGSGHILEKYCISFQARKTETSDKKESGLIENPDLPIRVKNDKLYLKTNLNLQQGYRRHNQRLRFQRLQAFLFSNLECIRFSIYLTSAKVHFDQTKMRLDRNLRSISPGIPL